MMVKQCDHDSWLSNDPYCATRIKAGQGVCWNGSRDRKLLKEKIMSRTMRGWLWK